ncbi:hypothetical protein KR093_005191, partial [Drosophila rubida]
ANHYYLEKQRFLLEILHRVHEPLLQEQWLGLGQQIVSDQSQYVHYNEHMEQFYAQLSAGRLLARDVYYDGQQPEHCQQYVGLFHFFYNTREWSTLRQNICWARVNANPVLFLHALLQTLMKRDDYRALVVPKIYELLPAPYHHEQLLHTALRFNQANLQPSQALLPLNLPSELRNTSQWRAAMSEVQLLSIDAGLTPLTEDPGWRAYWYYINMATTLLQEPQDTARLREWCYWQLSQLVARYQLEQLEQRVPGRRSAARTWLLQRYGQQQSVGVEQQLRSWEQRVETALATHSCRLANGSHVELSRGQNWQLGLAELFPYDLSQLRVASAVASPQQLLDPHTMLRDVNFYALAARVLRLYRAYRAAFQPDYAQPVLPTEMRLVAVQASALVTYDEPVDVDISSLLPGSQFYADKRFQWPLTLQVRRLRLQQRPFNLTFQLQSNRTQSIVLRSFLTTASGTGPYYQLDAFLTVLQPGHNTLSRASVDFAGTVGDHLSYTELYHYVRLAERQQFDFPLNITTPSCGFPRRLLLPRGGSQRPLAMRLFVVATPYQFKARQAQEVSCDFSSGVSSWDALPFGYPFERQLEAPSELSGDNASWQEVAIVHER